MPAITGLELITDSYQILNVFLPGEAVPAAQAQSARRILNRMLSRWRSNALTIPVVARVRFDLVAFQGGPTFPYTVGPGGNFDTPRPSTQQSIQQANLILTATQPEVRVPLGPYTDQSYFANQLPTMGSSQPTSYYYNPTYQGDLGSFYLWPVPTTSVNDLELLVQMPLSIFADLTTVYDVPDAAVEALVYNLAYRLAGPMGRQMTPDDRSIAMSSLSAFKRANVKMSDLMNDAQWAVGGRNTIYNIQTGNG